MNSNKSSYKQIVKSTSIYGTSQLVNIVLGIVRSKLTAIFLGTTGIGIIGLFQSVVDLSRSATGLGLDTGATKNIATTNAEDVAEVQKTLYTINLWYLATAIMGALVCILFAKPLSLWAFDSSDYTLHIVALSIAVLLITLTAGIVSSLQGLRKIPYMAFTSSLGSFLSLFAMIPIYYFWRIDGIVPMFIATNVIIFAVAFYFYRKIEIKPIKIPTKEVLIRGKGMMRLGLYMVAAGILSAVSLLLVRAYINRVEGVEVVGLFQAAWVITALVWGIVLRSTNSEFFPKLCSLVEDREATKTFVNEQTYIVMLIISPIIIGLVTFSEPLIHLLYTSEFVTASGTLRWHLAGAFFKIVATPIATIMLAKNRGGLHLICETIFWGVYLLTCYFLYPLLGLKATGVAYFAAYIIYIPMVLIASYRICKTMWNGSIVLMLLVNMFFIVLLYVTVHYFYDSVLLLGSALVLLTLLYSLYKLRVVVSYGDIKQWLKNRRQQ